MSRQLQSALLRRTSVYRLICRISTRTHGYVVATSSRTTRRNLPRTWKHFVPSCRHQSFSPLSADTQVFGPHSTASAPGTEDREEKPNSVSTNECLLTALWNYAQLGTRILDRMDGAIATVLAGIRNEHTASPRQKEALLPEDLIAVLETLEKGRAPSSARPHDAAARLSRWPASLKNYWARHWTRPDAAASSRSSTERYGALRGETDWRELAIVRGSNNVTSLPAALTSLTCSPWCPCRRSHD